MIEVREVTKTFNAGQPSEFTALRGISLAIEPGRVTALKGPSGSGKTTLLSVMGCMSRPTSGRVWFRGEEITSLPERFLTELRRRSFGFIFQQFNLLKGITALENVMLPAYPTGEPHGDIRARALRLFDRFEMSAKAHAPVEWLSGGQAQRVAIMRALINNPDVIIADEPTAHLDSKLSEDLLVVLGELNREGKTLILSSHDAVVYESSVVHSVVSVRDGQVEP